MSARVIGPSGLPDFKPVNAWGKAMPPPPRPLKPPPLIIEGEARQSWLWQVQVRLPDKRMIPVGPKMMREQAERFCAAIGYAISRGKERTWADPHLVRCT